MKSELTIGIICAMDSETEAYLSFLQEPKIDNISGVAFYSGKKSDKKLIIAKCGIGKVNAARCTQLMIDLFHPDYIINSGIAGGVDESLCVGDVVIGRELVQHDFDVTAFGHAKGYLCTGERDDIPTVFHADEKLVLLLEKSAKGLVKSKVHTGRIASGDIFVAESTVKQSLYQEFGAAAVEMEGAAIAQTAVYAGVPFVTLRVISDRADGTAAESFEIFEKQTAVLSCAVVQNLISLL